MLDFGIKDILDILIVAMLLYYVYRLMKSSGTLSLFYGVLLFIVIWVVASEIFGMRMTGTILDKFMGIGLIVLVILFQDQIKRFLIDIGSQRKLKVFRKLFRHDDRDDEVLHASVMAVVYACMSMSKSKTGALICVQRRVPLGDYEKTGDIIDADINVRLIENIFFKNSPLHDGAMIISDHRIKSVGCILPVSHDMNVPKNFGLRHRAALGLSQVTDAVCVVVSEETGHISVADNGSLKSKVSTSDLEHFLSDALAIN
ncbi:MAG: TIGR00159 family protein [Bacteroidales bacterium]|nr:TIGR00159 family protein [Bacteroidales bacterium]MBD5191056.1 TIGR00159 family protein [Bacteroidales bacterium]MBD5208798.1 TIGR00159 family protein [Bacteroidales bacterium]MDE6083951.1 diadenylate cyclase CdaA [Muribaculaceae bacterium]